MAKKANIADRRATSRSQTPAAQKTGTYGSRTTAMKSEFTKGKATPSPDMFPLLPYNLKLIAIGIGIIILGFIVMSGSENIYGFVKTGLATIIVLAGFLFVMYAIMATPPSERKSKEVADTDVQ